MLISAVGVHQELLHAEDGYGSISGQFVFEGPIPELPLLVKKGDDIKDAENCAAVPIRDESLIVDPKTRGVAHVFIFLRKAPAKIHPDLQSGKEKEVILTYRHCQFVPHSLFVRTDQTLVLKSEDGCAHNPHLWPIKNQPTGSFLKPNEKEGLRLGAAHVGQPEILPIKITCDIHSHMQGYVMILDHPYAAISDHEGKFQILLLPEGEHEFRIWHERVGWINRSFPVKVEAGRMLQLPPMKLPRELLTLDH